ncbi:UNVERIFIED_ORG: YesN/AraC family two-component response regulator [Heyndrickxia coagulans]
MYIEFISPPMPHLVVSGTSVFRPGDIHERRMMNGTFDLIVMKQGTLFLQEEGYQYSLKRGDYLILSPGKLHKGYRPCMEVTHFNWLHFSTTGNFQHEFTTKAQQRKMMNQKKYYKKDDFSFFLSKNGHLEEDTLEQLLYTMNSLVEVEINHKIREKRFLPAKIGELEAQQLFLGILSILQQKNYKDSSKNLASQIYAYIAAHTKQPFSLANLSQEFSYHKAYIIQLIKDAYSITPAQLHTRLRMEEAKSLLKNTNFPIQEIAGEVGYDDPAYFCKQFKKKTGVTPKVYRNQYQ